MCKAYDFVKEGKLYFLVEIEYDLDSGVGKVVSKKKLTDSKARAIHKGKEIVVKKIFGMI